MTFNMGVKLEELPAGLDRALLRVLSFHVGRTRAIGRQALVRELKISHGIDAHERVVRDCINQMRHQGVKICSTGGEGGGYWMAANPEELEEYLEREVHPRAMDLLEQEQALREAARMEWGEYSKQMRLEI
jgi:hypothetical protein